jgi:hypothetical protein
MFRRYSHFFRIPRSFADGNCILSGASHQEFLLPRNIFIPKNTLFCIM